MKKAELSIKGMHCNSCTVLIKDALTETEGVKDAAVDLKNAKATVTFDENKINTDKLLEAIKKEGYEASLAK